MAHLLHTPDLSAQLVVLGLKDHYFFPEFVYLVVEIVCIVPTWGLYFAGSADYVTCCAYFLDYFLCHIFYLGLFGVKNILKKITLGRTALTLKKSASADVRIRVNIQWLLNSARPLNSALRVVAAALRAHLLVSHCISLKIRDERFKLNT